jgi:hypothetical protein
MKHVDNELIKKAGGITAVASLCGCSRQLVMHWTNRGIPARWKLQYPLQLMHKTEVRAFLAKVGA